MLKRVFWLIALAIGGWIAWQWFRQRQSEFGDTMPQFSPAPRYTPPTPAPSIASQPPAAPPPNTAPEVPAPTIAASELDELFEDAPTPPAVGAADAPPTTALADSVADAEIVGYCMRCRTKRPMQNPHEEISESGRRAARGTCPVCGTNMFVFLAANEDE